jgi:hypothetical protein
MKDAPLCLHSHRIVFDHPLTGKRVTFECPAPSWANVVVRVVHEIDNDAK